MARSNIVVGSKASPALKPSTVEQERQKVRALLASDVRKMGARYYLVSFKWFQLWKDYVSYDSDDNEFSNGKRSTQRPGPIDNSDLLEVVPKVTEKSESASTENDPNAHEREAIDDLLETTTSISDECSDSDDEQDLQIDDDSDDGDDLEGLRLRKDIIENYDYVLLPELVWRLFKYEWYGGGPEIEREVIRVGVCNQYLKVELYPIRICVHLSDRQKPPLYYNTTKNATMKQIVRWAGSVCHQAPHKLEMHPRGQPEKTLATHGNATIEELNLGEFPVFVVIDPEANAIHNCASTEHTYATPSYFHAPRTITNDKGKPDIPGATGLHNLGNTCYMNAGLQCLFNVNPLLVYFLNGQFKNDLNTSNKLGTQGNLANAFSTLVKEIWSGEFLSVVPREFRNILVKYAPQFDDYQQHDAQELLMFVMDLLHEDLNKGVPNCAKIPNDGNLSAAELSQKLWDNHLCRNNSKFVELFSGQYRSMLTCEKCKHQSTIFDPFNCLSLPLPSKQTRNVNAVYIPISGKLIKFGVEVPKSGTIGDVITELKKLVNDTRSEDLKGLIIAEYYSSRMFISKPDKLLSEIREQDLLFAYEVDEIPSDDVEIVQVVQRSGRLIIGKPLLILIDKKLTAKQVHERIMERVINFLNLDKKLFVSIANDQAELPESDELVGGFLSKDSILYINWSDPHKLADANRTLENNTISHGSLKFKDETQGTLQDCLQLFTNEEELAWNCPKCQSLQNSKKKIDLWRLPQVLMIHLKRFQYTRAFREKITTSIRFPVTDLNMGTQLPEGAPTSEAVYNLFGTVNHTGGLFGGHYYSQVKNITNDTWYKFDDSRVSNLSELDTNDPTIYVLFYYRSDVVLQKDIVVEKANDQVEEKEKEKEKEKEREKDNLVKVKEQEKEQEKERANVLEIAIRASENSPSVLTDSDRACPIDIESESDDNELEFMDSADEVTLVDLPNRQPSPQLHICHLCEIPMASYEQLANHLMDTHDDYSMFS